ncbi:MAG TPA: Uma2 family endonuclease [Pirellulales bacterium]|nr:Uma2 family endonuclease [Pirellulales bacterium]
MATIEQPRVAEVVSEVILLREIPWELYEQLRDIPENWGKRMTYDQGDLEIMSPSARHEDSTKLLARMLETFTEELNIAIRGLRSTTWKDPRRKFGLEADECYYVQNEARVRHLEDFDLTRDPPPDVVIEVEASRSAIGKLPLYAKLGVPEVWRCTKGRLGIFLLADDGQYVASEKSLNIPLLDPAELNRFLQMRASTDETTWIRSFRAWIREAFPGGAA